jgi:hypothetical protein
LKRLLTTTLTGMTFLIVASVQANAGQVFDLTYSGATLGNNATATGTITLELLNMNNPGTTDQNPSLFVTDFSITVTGASSGNGTFGFSDFNGSGILGGFYLATNGGTLDFGSELVGQPTSGSAWGTTPSSGAAGDFNIFTNGTDPTAPNGTFFFQITTNGGSGDSLFLTSFAPAPEPGSALLVLPALIALGALKVRKRVRP